MTTEIFRARMRRAGRPLYQDQHVCHIIASANGGIDHSDNFFVASDRFNLATGAGHDALVAYLAGREATEQAVALCATLGAYHGPRADELMRVGEQAFREYRAQRRRMEAREGDGAG
jgi:hypothetical protein